MNKNIFRPLISILEQHFMIKNALRPLLGEGDPLGGAINTLYYRVTRDHSYQISD